MGQEEQGSSRDHAHTDGGARADGGAHTPGPWQVDYHAYGDEETGRVEGYEPSGDFLCASGIVRLTDEANACLIAAAPELAADAAFLLDRLDEFEGAITGDEEVREFYGHVSPAISRLRATIAKALGRPDADTSGASVTDPGMNTDQPSEG
jgi:hypothetical protein